MMIKMTMMMTMMRRQTHTHRPRLEAAGCGKNLTQGDQKPKTKDDDHNIDVYNVHTCSILTI